ncbi:MAG TPA: dephospho-CoA kinase [Chloroflexota bacterium]|nr:dephospho-CoA kinase [Chloroflexota bacterium]
MGREGGQGDGLPYIIGLTGNIACGKSTVAEVLREHGATVIDADKVAHQVMAPPGPVFDALLADFGQGILTPEGQIDRKKLGAIVFANPAALRRLDQIVHPATSAAIRQLAAGAAEPVVVVEAIKLIEAGTYRICDSVWVVTCTREQQNERLIAKRGLSPADAERRVAAQANPAEKLAYANVVIDASGTLADTRRQVDEAWDRVVKPSILHV